METILINEVAGRGVSGDSRNPLDVTSRRTHKWCA